MAYKSIMGRDTGMSMPIGITSVGDTWFPVAAELFGCRHWSPIGVYWTCYFW
jgi:hypothetical protein